ncbi:hypothetical protein GIB67_019662 [Kingdonia uniflora]|uniref:Uncharacterized protein n=1 Tax=Kingdonia uniflora TaxID=39325 RepID=A0A7J7MJS9_9MAGN|nr:hypothetical protein GIB67_019662 [Kingdonia uniflora]
MYNVWAATNVLQQLERLSITAGFAKLGFRVGVRFENYGSTPEFDTLSIIGISGGQANIELWEISSFIQGEAQTAHCNCTESVPVAVLVFFRAGMRPSISTPGHGYLDDAVEAPRFHEGGFELTKKSLVLIP